MEKILVLDCQMRSALAAIRALGKAGIEVTGAEKTRFATGFFSKYCKKHIVYPDPETKTREFINFILRELRTNQYDMILPIADETLIPLSKHKEEIEKYTIFPFQGYEKLELGFDKSETMKLAKKLGIPIPETHLLNKQSTERNYQLTKIPKTLSFPLIIKPTIGSGSRGLFIIKNQEDFEKRKQKINKPYLIQEFIPKKEEIGVYTLFIKGKPIALTVQKRLRSYPVEGGPSTLRETIEDKNNEATNLAFKILKAIKWDGIAMVEFRRDSRDNQLKLIEINPRFWGSLELSIRAGVNFPLLLYQLYKTKGSDNKKDNLLIKNTRELIGNQVANQSSASPAERNYHLSKNLVYQKGIRCRWILPGDILWFLSSKKTLANIKEFLKFREKDKNIQLHYDIFYKDDPLPVLGFFLAALRYSLSRKMWGFVVRKV